MLIALLAVLGVDLIVRVAYGHDAELLLGPYLEPVGTTAATSEVL
jgi:hypothetical protein